MQRKHDEGAPQAQDSVASRDESDNVTSSDKDPNALLVSRIVAADDIRLCAYKKWESEGKPAGDGIRFWLDAEKEVAQANSRC
jgi:hypothetical protein